MASIVDSIYRGSYDGHPIVFEDASTKGGRKYSKKEYPNRDDQNMQDLGLRPRSYSLTIVVNASSPDNYFEERDALLAVLEKEGSATLVHPLYGSIKNMVAPDWDIVEESGRLGEGKISVTFEPDSDSGIPVNAQETLSGVLALLADANNAIADALESGYEIKNNVFGVATSALKNVNNFVDNITEATSFVGTVTADASGLALQLADIQSDVNSLIQNPTQMTTSMLDVFQTTWGLFSSEEDSLKSFEKLFDYGSDVVEFDYSSRAITTIKNNNAQFRNFSNGNALTGAYKAAIQIENSTVEGIDTISTRLDAQYEIVITDPDLTVAAKNAIMDARVAVIDYLNVLRLTAAEVVDVYVQVQPARLVSFSYYNDSTRADEIIELNGQPDLSFVSGDIQILSE